MDIERFCADFFPLVKRTSRAIIRSYSGWFNDPEEEFNDLISTGMLELVTIYKRVNFADPGYKGYVSQRVHGCLLNYVYKNIPKVEWNTSSEPEVSGTASKAKQFTRLASIDEMVEMDCEPGECPQIEDLLFRHKVLDLIAEFLADLDPKITFLLVARFQDEKTYEEIGSIVQMRREAVSGKINDTIIRLGKFFRKKCSWRLDPADIAVYLQETDLSEVVFSDEDGAVSATKMEKQL